MCKSLGGLRSNCVASALNSARYASFCFNPHVVLHGARCDRKAMLVESLGVLLAKHCNCRGGRSDSPLSTGTRISNSVSHHESFANNTTGTTTTHTTTITAPVDVAQDGERKPVVVEAVLALH